MVKLVVKKVKRLTIWNGLSTSYGDSIGTSNWKSLGNGYLLIHDLLLIIYPKSTIYIINVVSDHERGEESEGERAK